MTIGLHSNVSSGTVFFLSPYIADRGSGGGLVGRTNLACLREAAPQTVAFALSNEPTADGYTCIGAPKGTLATALCNMVGLAGRLTPAGLLRSARLILQFRPCVVFIDSSSLGWVALFCRILLPRARVIVFFYNIEFDFQIARSHSEGRRYWISAVAEYVNERLSVMSAHTLLMLTQHDSRRATELYGRGADHLAPVALNDNLQAAMAVHRESNRGSDAVLFVGSNFFANREAADFLVHQLAPTLGQHLPTQIWIAGDAFSPCSAHPNLPPNVHVLGRVEDLSLLYRDATAVVAPIFSGAGMKVKVAEALMHGCPVIGTPLALRGYNDDNSKPHLLTASCVADYVKAIAECRSRRPELGQSARNDFLERFSLAAAARRMKIILERHVARRH